MPLPPQGCVCVADLASVISETPPSFGYDGGQVICVDFSVLDEAKTFPAGVDGHFFHGSGAISRAWTVAVCARRRPGVPRAVMATARCGA